MLATCLHMMQGTPYVYQGEELGMTNMEFNTVEDFCDIESINAYHEYVDSGKIDGETMMRYLRYKSRDNSRTPMQWNAGKNAGFSTGTPWMRVNPNYEDINAEEQIKREDSVFSYYKELIRLRKEKEIIVYGHYELLMPEDEKLFVYTRSLDNEKLLVICNFTEDETVFSMPDEFTGKKVLVGNYKEQEAAPSIRLRPYEALVIEK